MTLDFMLRVCVTLEVACGCWRVLQPLVSLAVGGESPVPSPWGWKLLALEFHSGIEFLPGQ